MTMITVNEAFVQKALRDLPYVDITYDIGLMADTELAGFARSVDGIALLDMTKISAPSEWHSSKSVQDKNWNAYALSVLEIKTRLSNASLNEMTPFIR